MALAESPAAFGESPEEHGQTTVADFERRLAATPDASFVYAAFDGDRMVGTAGLYRESRIRRRHRALVWGVFVDPAWRGQGIARRLLDGLIEEARRIPDLEQLILDVSVGQQPARSVYAAVGFRSLGIVPRALRVGDQYHDEERMLLEL